MLKFGDAMHKLIPDDRRPDPSRAVSALFPHRRSFRTAIEAAAHLADVDISIMRAVHRIAPALRGRVPVSITGPGIPMAFSFSSQSWAFYKNEGLLDRFLLTGDLWSRDVARMSADWGVCFNDLDIHFNTRSISHGLFAMLRAYEVFGEKKILQSGAVDHVLERCC